jgi:hypothetical protein
MGAILASFFNSFFFHNWLKPVTLAAWEVKAETKRIMMLGRPHLDQQKHGNGLAHLLSQLVG